MTVAGNEWGTGTTLTAEQYWAKMEGRTRPLTDTHMSNAKSDRSATLSALHGEITVAERAQAMARRDLEPYADRTVLAACGTDGAYMRHVRAGETCEVCRLAHNHRQRIRTAERRARKAS